MSNNNTRTTVNIPEEQILAELNQAPVPPKDLQEEIQKDFYDAMRRIFDAPIIFLTGVAMIPGAFASWLGSENKKETNTKNVRISPFTFFGVFLVASLVLFQAEAKTVLRYFLFQKGILVNPKTQLFLEKGCIADRGVVIPSHEEGVLETPLPGGNKCSHPQG